MTKKKRWWNFVHSSTNKCKITNWKERSKTELIGRRPLRRRMSALDCSAIWGDDDEEEEEEEEGLVLVLLFCILKVSDSFPDCSVVVVIIVYREFLSNSKDSILKNIGVDKKNQLDVTFCILYFSSNSCSTCWIQKVTSSWFFLSTRNYDARSTTHQMNIGLYVKYPLLLSNFNKT